MHILLVHSGTNNRDGWSNYSKTLHEALEKEGHTVSVFIATHPISFLTNPLKAVIQAQKLRSTLKKIRPDLVHITVEPLVMMLAFLPAQVLRQCVLTVHGSYGVRLFQGRNAKRAHKILPKLGAIVTVSHYTKKRLLEEAGGLSNIHVVHNAIELPRSTAHETHTTKQVICVGGIKPRKGITESLDALAQYIETKNTNVHLTIIGSYKNDTYYQQVVRSIDDRHLHEYVTITGPVSDHELRSYFHKADLLLMPAKTTPDTFEGFGLVYIEANAYGVPSIGPDDSGAAEAIEHGVSGYQIDPNNPEDLANAMYKILEESSIQPENCRKWAEKFDAKNLGKAMLSVYELLQSNA